MPTPRWKALLENPDRIDPVGVDLAIVTDGGDEAYRAALGRWNRLRHQDDRDAHAGIAYILAEAFDDLRGLQELASEWPETLPEELSWRLAVAGPSQAIREVFGPKVLAPLRDWLDASMGEEVPHEEARIARTLFPDDDGEVYLPLRRVLMEVVDIDDPGPAERVADDLLVAAASATPDSQDVQRTVLAYWGEEPPLDEVPTADPLPGEPPASWYATCELIARSRRPEFADRVIEVATRDEEAWNGPGSDAETLVLALGESAGGTADAKLLEIAKARVPMSGTAVRTLADRRRRLSGSAPEMTKHMVALVKGMIEHGILEQMPGKHTLLALARQRRADEDPMTAATAIADALGRPTGEELAPEWSAFSAWLEDAELPGPAPVPAAPQKRERGGLGRLFGRR
ncbi:hypothetical protein [Gulosibacter sp. 10]|uniref:hypothetical protein n=1 Tax=Gulosibacter sp. 10 TaxID=1255570 RepID=UPI00097F2D07|nr:hypothetical protein [Gulosibacter sp. 10]SJM66693.1 hypothetical protein FM112_11990 [Gulosibacter sp. 10]